MIIVGFVKIETIVINVDCLRNLKGERKDVMHQNCCKQCGSISLHTEAKGNNTGLYCDDCGAWVKWLGKDELRAFEHSKTTRIATNQIMNDGVYMELFVVKDGIKYNAKIVDMKDVTKVLTNSLMDGIEKLWQ